MLRNNRQRPGSQQAARKWMVFVGIIADIAGVYAIFSLDLPKVLLLILLATTAYVVTQGVLTGRGLAIFLVLIFLFVMGHSLVASQAVNCYDGAACSTQAGEVKFSTPEVKLSPTQSFLATTPQPVQATPTSPVEKPELPTTTPVLPPDEPPATLSPPAAATETPDSLSGGGEESSATCPKLKVSVVVGVVDWLYSVKPGDTITAIALFFYKDGGRWLEIYLRNKDSLGGLPSDGSPAKVYPGQIIYIPNIVSPLRVDVLADDTLYNIASRGYGYDYNSGVFWCAVYNQNKERIGDDPSFIHVGQVFELYPITPLSANEVWVPPNSTFRDLVSIYYLDTVSASVVCDLQPDKAKFGSFCENISPFDHLYFPSLPAQTSYVIRPGQPLREIVQHCYNESTEFLLRVALVVNRHVVGDNPSFVGVGQVVTLYGCKS